MHGKQYYDLLGLPENASLILVKKRFRALAKEYHPDLNPGPEATAYFQTLLDAYERILKKEFEPQRKAPEQPHRTAAEIHRERWERMNQRWKAEEEAMDEYYFSLISGWRLRVKYLFALLSFWILSSLVLDEFLPLIPIQDKVVGFSSTSYQSFNDSYVHEVQLANHGSIYVADYDPQVFKDHPNVILYQTRICRSNKEILHGIDPTLHEVHFSLCRFKILLFLFLGLTLILPFFRKPSTFLVLGSWIGLYLSGPLIIFCFVFYGRFISIFTLGYFP